MHVKFNDAKYGETRGKIVAAPETYGINKLWVMLEPIPIELGGSSPSEHDDSDDEGAGPVGRARGGVGCGAVVRHAHTYMSHVHVNFQFTTAVKSRSTFPVCTSAFQIRTPHGRFHV